ncbi:hypothetical protein DPEC_G00344170 [Dallia pectoralis]|uniref:Uncharacterized protein n=1 Tax=Dallia pectoralis TaxID=75939 RepID=A0ACC2F3B5_DALPE|nr:hypothetical protein DPEC_G00344170 [Dallia pectoralis]
MHANVTANVFLKQSSSHRDVSFANRLEKKNAPKCPKVIAWVTLRLRPDGGEEHVSCFHPGRSAGSMAESGPVSPSVEEQGGKAFDAPNHGSQLHVMVNNCPGRPGLCCGPATGLHSGAMLWGRPPYIRDGGGL